MKFKILKGTSLYDELMKLKERCKTADEASVKLAEEVGVEKFCFSNDGFVLAGGISAFEFKEQPTGWKLAFPKHYKDAYFPKKLKSNKDIIEKIEALPLVDVKALNDILKYDMWDRRNQEQRKVSFHPGVIWKKEGYVLVSIADYVVYTPLDDMIEILESEYTKLAEEAKKVNE